MRGFRLLAWLNCYAATFAIGPVPITESPTGWEMTNGHIRVELVRSPRTVQLKSLRRWCGGSSCCLCREDRTTAEGRASATRLWGAEKCRRNRSTEGRF